MSTSTQHATVHTLAPSAFCFIARKRMIVHSMEMQTHTGLERRQCLSSDNTADIDERQRCRPTQFWNKCNQAYSFYHTQCVILRPWHFLPFQPKNIRDRSITDSVVDTNRSFHSIVQYRHT